MEVFADELTLVFTNDEDIKEAVATAKAVSRMYSKEPTGTLVSFHLKGVDVHVRLDSINEYLERTYAYSLSSDTPFDVGPYPDDWAPPFLRRLGERAIRGA
jgi:hypothetical protein